MLFVSDRRTLLFKLTRSVMATNKLTRTLVALALLQSDVVSAYWREACSVAQMARLDPILNPGTISGHVHKFAGGISTSRVA